MPRRVPLGVYGTRGDRSGTANTRETSPAPDGDHSGVQVRRSLPPGPPPRSRGPPPLCAPEGAYGGTTPACAGTTRPAGSSARRARDHPRVRGDHRSPSSSRGLSGGPPPRARGPLRPVAGAGEGVGTTPACAGTTWRTGSTMTPCWDHPRVGGDHLLDGLEGTMIRGPPPRARGPPPAPVATRPPRRDHPRVRGDHREGSIMARGLSGPPPRARGPLVRTRSPDTGRGTTPACAGTTQPVPGAEDQDGDHPRVRGDHWPSCAETRSSWGPPPRARGPP